MSSQDAQLSRSPHEREHSARSVAHVVYALYALSIVTALPALIGAILAHVKRSDAMGTFAVSHLDWQVRTFWWWLLWAVIGGALTVILVGWLILAVAWLWFAYRVLRGWLRLVDDLPAYAW